LKSTETVRRLTAAKIPEHFSNFGSLKSTETPPRVFDVRAPADISAISAR